MRKQNHLGGGQDSWILDLYIYVLCMYWNSYHTTLCVLWYRGRSSCILFQFHDFIFFCKKSWKYFYFVCVEYKCNSFWFLCCFLITEKTTVGVVGWNFWNVPLSCFSFKNYLLPMIMSMSPFFTHFFLCTLAGWIMVWYTLWKELSE